jgi:hypothetical protein
VWEKHSSSAKRRRMRSERTCWNHRRASDALAISAVLAAATHCNRGRQGWVRSGSICNLRRDRFVPIGRHRHNRIPPASALVRPSRIRSYATTALPQSSLSAVRHVPLCAKSNHCSLLTPPPPPPPPTTTTTTTADVRFRTCSLFHATSKRIQVDQILLVCQVYLEESKLRMNERILGGAPRSSRRHAIVSRSSVKTP